MTDTAERTPRSDHDSPWKEALEGYFPEFLALLFPRIHAGIDWSRGHRFLDKEFQQIVRDADIGRRYADKLVGLHRLDGQPAWVLVHVEVQGEPETAFAERMFVYNHKIRDAHGVPVASLAVLADADPRFRPEHYHDDLWGCSVDLSLPDGQAHRLGHPRTLARARGQRQPLRPGRHGPDPRQGHQGCRNPQSLEVSLDSPDV
jgi:hypothetical protein